MSEKDHGDLDEDLNAVLRAEILGLRKRLAERDAEIETLRRQRDPEGTRGVAPLDRPRVRVKAVFQPLRELGQRLVLFQQIRALKRSELFDPEWYAATYEECPGPRDAALHYVREGSAKGFDPGPNFSTKSYYRANTDVAAAGWPALSHYLLHGRAEGRRMMHETGP